MTNSVYNHLIMNSTATLVKPFLRCCQLQCESGVKRYPYLDWLRGLAILIMIQCHAFNSFTRMDLRDGGPYVLSQFVGGMAAPLFLFMAGMTTGFQMESLAQRETSPRRRWLTALKRGGYILGIAFTFRFTNWLFSVPRATLQEITK